MKTQPKRIPISERFWPKVNKTDYCWLWTAMHLSSGYGLIGSGGHGGHNLLAHRVSWEIHNGPIPEGLCILHKCDNPPCVNPDHLFSGTHKDNVDDCIAKGRKKTWNKDITHCKRGHPFSQFGYTYPNGTKRSCTLCMRMHQKKFYYLHIEECRIRSKESMRKLRLKKSS